MKAIHTFVTGLRRRDPTMETLALDIGLCLFAVFAVICLSLYFRS